MSAWNELKNTQGDQLVISTNNYINLWTPAYTGKHVWIGHSHETPDYHDRKQLFEAWRKTENAQEFNRFLSDNGITCLLSINENEIISHGNLLDDAWRQIFIQADAAVWQKQKLDASNPNR